MNRRNQVVHERVMPLFFTTAHHHHHHLRRKGFLSLLLKGGGARQFFLLLLENDRKWWRSIIVCVSLREPHSSSAHYQTKNWSHYERGFSLWLFLEGKWFTHALIFTQACHWHLWSIHQPLIVFVCESWWLLMMIALMINLNRGFCSLRLSLVRSFLMSNYYQFFISAFLSPVLSSMASHCRIIFSVSHVCDFIGWKRHEIRSFLWDRWLTDSLCASVSEWS